jgi:hypothetical protein
VETITVTKLGRAELKSYFETTGELPDRGAHVDPGGDKFFIREKRVSSEVHEVTSPSEER